jgi:hypothetical protein
MAFSTRCLLLVSIITFIRLNPCSAQDQVNVRILLKSYSWSGFVGDKHGPRLKFFRDQVDASHILKTANGSECFELPSASSGSKDYVEGLNVGYFNVPVSNPSFSIYLETWEKRKDNSNSCGYHDDTGEFNQPDRHHAWSDASFNLNSYPQGELFYREFVNTEGGSVVRVVLSFIYTPAKPTMIDGNADNNCAHNPYTLKTALPQGLNNETNLKYEWQFRFDGDQETVDPEPYEDCTFTDCDQAGNCWPVCLTVDPPPYQVDSWTSLASSLGSSSSSTITFAPLDDLFAKAQQTSNRIVNTNKKVYFRVRASGAERSSEWYGGPVFNFSPPPPSSTATATTEASCPSSATGKIILDNISSLFSTYRYILKKGDVATLGCDPQGGTCLSDIQTSGQNSGNRLELASIPVGTYSLFLLNDGGVQGVCPRRIGNVITVSAIPDLSVSMGTPVQIVCNGANNGIISLSIAQGRFTSVDYDLTNLLTNDLYHNNTSVASAAVSFSGLKPGNHSLTISDGCTPAIVRTFEITQPVKVSTSEFQKVDATCTDPGNGIAKVTVTKSISPDVSVSTIYHYQIFKGGTLYNELDLAASTYTWTGLPVNSDYKIVVKEKGGQDCNGAVANFAIAGPVALGIQTPVLTNVTCFGGNDGAIKVNGTGGTDSYIYELSGAAVLSNSTGEFINLAAGNYIITVRNTITCNDKYVHPAVTINQPTEVVATISKKDISCFGLTDGEITSIVSGGTPASSGYSYTWEMQTGSSWTSLSKTTSSLTGLGEGTYRLKAKDEKECPATSNEVAIVEPAAVGISNVSVTDIKCYGEKGSIAITGTGGTGAYIFAYSLNGASFTNFNSSTQLTAGIYRVKITDDNGCSYQDANDHIITTPASALNFTETLSDYNGYNISCYGGGNGTASITATGGNGANYSGYQYALDNGSFGPDALLTGIYAGGHTIKVKDARGCIGSKTVTFTQTTATLSTVLVEKKDVTCYGDVTGVLEFTGSGGLAPYQYSLDKAAFQEQGRFSGLGANEYTVVIKDKNECDNTATYSIVTINPKIEIATSPTDVSCFGGSDGEVATSITGGVAPFQYQWTGLTTTSSVATGLIAGSYTVKVTDKAGCKMEASASIEQPHQALTTNLTTVPVCYGRTNGSITVTTTGGTEPYLYSIDNGQSFQSDAVFLKGVGSYTLTSKDSKGCTITATTEVVLRNDKPEPNFLVVSSRNAMDTIVIIDVSVPKPDSIYWIFDPKAIVINNDGWSPQLHFVEAGTYFIGMTGYFGGCDYAQAANITVNPYDPSIIDEKLPNYKPIQSVSVTPNPSSGQFEISVTLAKKYNLSIVVYDVLGNRHYNNTWESIDALKETITLNDVSAGVYLLRVVTESDAQDVRLLINK